MDRPSDNTQIFSPSQWQLFGTLCLVWMLLNLPVLLGIRVLPWDAIDEFYPTVYFNSHTLRMGMLPWWNPFIYAGFPQVADPQGMLFSPLLMGWMLVLRDPGVTWFDWGVLLHLLMGGAAMLQLLQRSGGSRFGALLGAIVFMAGGVAASRLEHVPDELAYAWSPVVLLALRRFLATPSWQRGFIWGLSAAALITHLVQVTFLLVLMIIGYFIAASAARWSTYTPSDRGRWTAGVAIAAATALVGGLPQLLFTWAYVALSNRASLPLAAASNGSLDPSTLLGLFDPNAWHALRGTYTGAASRVEGYLYIGAVPALMLCGLGKAWKSPGPRRQLLFFVAVFVFGFLYMLGTHAAFYGWLYEWMPGIKQFRRPSDAAYLVNLSLAMFVGLGASQLDLSSRRQSTFVLVLAAVWLTLASMHMWGEGAHWQIGTILAATAAVLALWRLRQHLSPNRVAFWLLLVIIADYRCFNLNGRFNQGHDNAQRMRDSDVAAYLGDALGTGNNPLPYRIEPESAGILWDNYVILHGLQSTQGYNPLRYELYDRWYGAHENGTLPRADRPYNLGAGSKLDDLLGVRFVVAGHSQDLSSALAARGLTRTFNGKKADVWRNENAYPRLLNPTQSRVLSPGEILLPSDFSGTDFNRTIWLTPRGGQSQLEVTEDALGCSGQVHVNHVRTRASRIDLGTQAKSSGWLVLSELDFPGWRADADGRPLSIFRANGIFRAVCIPPGEHAVHFGFHPWLMVRDVWQRTHTW